MSGRPRSSASSAAAGSAAAATGTNGATAATADAAVARWTKWATPKSLSVTQVKPAWKSASFKDDTNTPRSARVTAAAARDCAGAETGRRRTKRSTGSTSSASKAYSTEAKTAT